MRIESEAFSESSLESIMIPCSVQILGSSCFAWCHSLSSITFESNSQLTRSESWAFDLSSFQSILIPRSVEILCSNCLSNCGLSSITFESNSRLTRIESCAFAFLSLQSIVIPRNVRFIDGSAFAGVIQLSISIESGNNIFVIENGFLIDVIHHKLIRNFSTSSTIIIPSDIEILGSSSFSGCGLLSSISFEYPSQLKRIESMVFEMIKVEVIIPSTILFVACDAIFDFSKIFLTDYDFCPEFHQWLRWRMNDIRIDFRRILRLDSGLPDLMDYLFDVSRFEEGSVLCGCEGVSNQLYRRLDDGCLIVVKSMSLLDSFDNGQLNNSMERAMNLRHPCIAALISFVFPAESSASRELKIAELSVEGGSLAEVLVTKPEWWTPIVKAKAVAGIALGLRFAHSFGLIHGRLTPSSILFDADHCIQIADFDLLGFERRRSENTTQARFCDDILAFVSLLFEIIVGHPATLSSGANSEGSVGVKVPEFVSYIIESSRCDSGRRCSFNDIVYALEEDRFEIVDSVDSVEVLAFVRWVELLEQLDE
jgi:hypothetical protein